MLAPKHLAPHLNHGCAQRIFGRPAALPLRSIMTYGMTSEGASSAGRAVTDSAEIAKLAASFRRVAVLGIKTERQADQPAFYVAEYLASAGVEVIPVPTYYPDVTTILGRPVYRTVAAAAAAASSPGEQQQPLDCVDVFRRPADVPGHVADVIAARPRVVWLQSGIRCPEAEEAWARAGLLVVADRCLMVEHRRGVAARL